jgi:26S proteasome subunit P45 family
MSTEHVAAGKAFKVSLEGIVRTSHNNDEVLLVFLEVTNEGEDVVQWWHDEHVFIDDEHFQHESAGLIHTGFTGESAIEIESDARLSPELFPSAKALCVTDVTLPEDRTLSRIIYRYGDEEYEFDLTPDDIDDLEMAPTEAGLGPSQPRHSESADATDLEPTEATSDSFEITLTRIVRNAGEGESDLTLFLFDVHNAGTQTTQWWYDEHTFVDSEGYQHAEEGAVTGGFGSDPYFVPEGYTTSPEIQPGATTRCITDVSTSSDARVREIHYEYSGERYEITLDKELWDALVVPYEEFEDEAIEVGDADDAGVDERVSAMVVDDDPDVSYDDIGGLTEQKRKVKEAIREPLLDPEQFETIGITPPEGVLLHGPPGTGKTMLAKAVANDADSTFIRLAGPELARAYLGEGAELVRECFEYARSRRPAIIFIDEIDSIAARRSGGGSGATEEVYRTMLQLLSEMDGFEDTQDVRIIAATNRINRLDEAILRPGRFDRIIKVPDPGRAGRRDIFAVHTAEMETADDLDLETLAERAEGLSGAEIEAVCTEAGYTALRDNREVVRQTDFLTALQEVTKERESREPTNMPGYR